MGGADRHHAFVGVWPSRMVRDGEESFARVNEEWKASLRVKERGLMGGVGGTTCGLSSNDIPGSWIFSVGVDAEDVCKKLRRGWGGGYMAPHPSLTPCGYTVSLAHHCPLNPSDPW